MHTCNNFVFYNIQVHTCAIFLFYRVTEILGYDAQCFVNNPTCFNDLLHPADVEELSTYKINKDAGESTLCLHVLNVQSFESNIEIL